MSRPIIEVNHLSKRYRLGTFGAGSLKQDLQDWWHRRNGKWTGHSAPNREELWALKDVSFEVQPGEVVGIIGRNGAGKSTLLKILSRITEPTEGEAIMRGRVASLLEVGTGFHPDLTGRENVYLNGTILGMKKAEIDSQFDEIVAFSELEKFIDTPVKRYSSGMYVRLAFAVAAHLQPEILIVDEVLAVGDAAFQKKCLGKVGEVSRRGRTVLLVSHNMAAVRTLCRRGLFFNEGRLSLDGKAEEAINSHLQRRMDSCLESDWSNSGKGPGNENLRLEYIRILIPEEGVITIDTGAAFEIGVFNFREKITLDCTVYLTNREGVLLFESGVMLAADGDSRAGLYHITGRIPGHLLNAGNYYMTVLFGKDQCYPLFRLEDAASFCVENTTTGRAQNLSLAPGVIRPLLNWKFEFRGQSLEQ